MKIVKHEFRQAILRTVITGCIFALFIYIGMMEYKAGGQTEGGYQELIDSLPKAVKAIFGMENNDLSTAFGYFTVLKVYIVLICSIITTASAVKIFAKEERKHTCEFINTRPMTRIRILLEKVSALAILTTINVIIISLFSFIVVCWLDGDTFGKLVAFSLGLWISQLFFVTLGTFIAARFQKQSNILIMIIIFGAYLIKVIADLFEQLNFVNNINPLTFFENYTWWVYLLQLLSLILGAILLLHLAIIGYKKKDLQ